MISKNGFETTEQRSILMSKIRSRNTKPELLLRKELWKLGYRYRIHTTKLPGNPDITFKGKKLAIFVDGAFWHGHNWEEKKFKINSNIEYWTKKIERNIERDNQNQLKLMQLGFTVLRFWDFEVKKNLSDCIKQIENHLTSCNKKK